MIFRVVIVNVGFVSHARQSSMSAPGWFKQRCPLIGKKTEAAPNSYTGSGRCLFPDSDGIASQSLPLGEFENRCVPETSPCHVQAKQNGELDPRRVARSLRGAFAAESRPRQTHHRQSATHRLSSSRARHVGSLGRLLRVRHLGHRRGGQSKSMRSSRRHT